MAVPVPNTSAEALAQSEQGSVMLDMPYVKEPSPGALPSYLELFAKDSSSLDIVTVQIRDVRTADREFSLATTGFQYVRMTAEDIDYTDANAVTNIYISALGKLVAEQ